MSQGGKRGSHKNQVLLTSGPMNLKLKSGAPSSGYRVSNMRMSPLNKLIFQGSSTTMNQQ